MHSVSRLCTEWVVKAEPWQTLTHLLGAHVCEAEVEVEGDGLQGVQRPQAAAWVPVQHPAHHVPGRHRAALQRVGRPARGRGQRRPRIRSAPGVMRLMAISRNIVCQGLGRSRNGLGKLQQKSPIVNHEHRSARMHTSNALRARQRTSATKHYDTATGKARRK